MRRLTIALVVLAAFGAAKTGLLERATVVEVRTVEHLVR